MAVTQRQCIIENHAVVDYQRLYTKKIIVGYARFQKIDSGQATCLYHISRQCRFAVGFVTQAKFPVNSIVLIGI